MKLKKPRWFISLYTGWLQNIYVLGLQYEKRHITFDTENKLCIPLPRANYYKNSFSYSVAILWNKPPCNVRQAESFKKFKCLLEEVL